MLNDPLYLASVNTSSEVLSSALSEAFTAGGVSGHALRLADLSPGKSVRVATSTDGIDKYTLTISNASSKENAPYPTQRTVFRLDCQKVVLEGKTVTCSAYLVVADPKGISGWTGRGLALAKALAGTILFGNRIDPALGSEAENSDRDLLQRVLAGEP